ncbi:MAG: hypothetical protein V4858_14495 [Pseudomonadota bacterium]
MALFSFIPDPLQMVRQLVNTLEARLNALANTGMKSERVARTLNELATLSFAAQHVFASVSGAILRRLNLPSRQEVSELALALRRIEEKLEQLRASQTLAPTAAPERPRPPRTRRPPAIDVVSPHVVTQASVKRPRKRTEPKG